MRPVVRRVLRDRVAELESGRSRYETMCHDRPAGGTRVSTPTRRAISPELFHLRVHCSG